MKKHLCIFFIILCPIFVFSQNVGIGTNTPQAKLNILGSYANPQIPNSPDSTSNGILRISSNLINDALDIGKRNGGTGTYDAWLQAGYLGIPDPISLQPLGGNVGIGLLGPSEKLEVKGGIKADSLDVSAGLIKNVADPIAAQDAATKAYVDNKSLPASPSAGEMVYYNGTSWILLPPGTAGQVLTISSGLLPSWTDVEPPPPPSCDLYLGQFYKGGYIFYLDSTGCHGLVAAPVDQGQVGWGCLDTLVIGGTSTSLGTGQANTTTIVNGCGGPGIAAKLCNDLVYGGYDDWFLPSKDELNLMWQNLADSDGDGSASGPSDPNNIGGFTTFLYWSSSEFNASNAWVQNFGVTNQHGFSKDFNVDVRAVRAF